MEDEEARAIRATRLIASGQNALLVGVPREISGRPSSVVSTSRRTGGVVYVGDPFEARGFYASAWEAREAGEVGVFIVGRQAPKGGVLPTRVRQTRACGPVASQALGKVAASAVLVAVASWAHPTGRRGKTVSTAPNVGVIAAPKPPTRRRRRLAPFTKVTCTDDRMQQTRRSHTHDTTASVTRVTQTVLMAGLRSGAGGYVTLNARLSLLGSRTLRGISGPAGSFVKDGTTVMNRVRRRPKRRGTGVSLRCLGGVLSSCVSSLRVSQARLRSSPASGLAIMNDASHEACMKVG